MSLPPLNPNLKITKWPENCPLSNLDAVSRVRIGVVSANIQVGFGFLLINSGLESFILEMSQMTNKDPIQFSSQQLSSSYYMSLNQLNYMCVLWFLIIYSLFHTYPIPLIFQPALIFRNHLCHMRENNILSQKICRKECGQMHPGKLEPSTIRITLLNPARSQLQSCNGAVKYRTY